MITRRSLMRYGMAAGLSASGSALSAGSGDGPEQRVARALVAAMRPALRQQLEALAVRRGFLRATLPSLHSQRAVIAAEFRAGASHRVAGLRFSQTELAWYVALHQRGGAA